MLGTPAYMAPEQFTGEGSDARTDQFSFCVALWEALHGRRPFAGTNVIQLMVSVASGAVREPPADTRVPAWIRRSCAAGCKSIRPSVTRRWPRCSRSWRAIRPCDAGDRARWRRSCCWWPRPASAPAGWAGPPRAVRRGPGSSHIRLGTGATARRRARLHGERQLERRAGVRDHSGADGRLCRALGPALHRDVRGHARSRGSVGGRARSPDGLPRGAAGQRARARGRARERGRQCCRQCRGRREWDAHAGALFRRSHAARRHQAARRSDPRARASRRSARTSPR